MDVYRRKRILFAYVVYKCVLERHRRHWEHPLTDARPSKGRFKTSFSDLQENSEKKIFSYVRMSVKSFRELLGRISDNKCFPGTEDPNMPYEFETISLSSNVMIPYSGNALSDKKTYIIIDYHGLADMW
ncbi:hypothetical protein PR048_007257 [Dryococelus australis]|uniref:Uncharacterized protein n=1 Tax=Dryococelus australis TaxID=614101 RepID=A0ABQ9IFA2_9NEOP|nr:hypothetical protein PR048_007257 [Dryococelus australis]